MGFETINHSLRVMKLLNITLYVIGWRLKFRLKKTMTTVTFCNMTTTHELLNQHKQLNSNTFTYFSTLHIFLYISLICNGNKFLCCIRLKKWNEKQLWNSNQPINHCHHIHGSLTYNCLKSLTHGSDHGSSDGLTLIPSRGATNVHNSGNDNRSIVNISRRYLRPRKRLLDSSRLSVRRK
jgi:hypothetical protein